LHPSSVASTYHVLFLLLSLAVLVVELKLYTTTPQKKKKKRQETQPAIFVNVSQDEGWFKSAWDPFTSALIMSS